MKYRALQNQRTRRTLNQQAMQRSHRRCDLIRLTPEDESSQPPPQAASEDERNEESEALASLS